MTQCHFFHLLLLLLRLCFMEFLFGFIVTSRWICGGWGGGYEGETIKNLMMSSERARGRNNFDNVPFLWQRLFYFQRLISDKVPRSLSLYLLHYDVCKWTCFPAYAVCIEIPGPVHFSRIKKKTHTFDLINVTQIHNNFNSFSHSVQSFFNLILVGICFEVSDFVETCRPSNC